MPREAYRIRRKTKGGGRCTFKLEDGTRCGRLLSAYNYTGQCHCHSCSRDENAGWEPAVFGSRKVRCNETPPSQWEEMTCSPGPIPAKFSYYRPGDWTPSQ